MWIVKLGGSLGRDAMLPRWLELMAELGGGRVIVVPGGGRFADQAREAQAWWKFGDLAAHNMAVLGMAQSAYQMHALCPALPLAGGAVALRQVLRRGQAAVWLPLELQRDQPDRLTRWEVSADSLALWLAQRLHAERVLLVKSCAIDPGASLGELAEQGVVDAELPRWAEGAGCSIDVLHKSELARARALLLAEPGACGPPLA